MVKTVMIAAATGAMLCATAAFGQAQVIHLASVNPDTGGAPAATTLVFGPGTYSAKVIGIANGGMYDAWNLASSNGQVYPNAKPAPAPGFYTEAYTISIGGAAPVTVNGGATYATAAAALAAYSNSPYVFTVTNPGTTVSFLIPDSFYNDNTGGVSLKISAVPEPATWAMMIMGLGAVGYTMRRRKAVVRTSYAV